MLSIYGVGGDVLKQVGTGAAGLFLLGIGAALVLAVVYAELASAYPYAGGDYVGVGSILGPWAGVASLAIWAAILGPGNAFTAKIIATYIEDLAPSVPTTVVTFGSLAAAVAIALLAARTSAIVTGLFLAIEMLTVCVLIGAGFWHPVRSVGDVIAHPVTLDAAGALGPVAIGSMALAAVSAAFGTCGGNQAIAFGEELHHPHRHMGNVILLAALIGALAIALPVVAVVLGASDLVSLLKSPAPFSAFMVSIAGPVAGHAMSAAVALAIFNALIVAIMFSARFFFSLGRDAIFLPRLNRMLASVHGTSGAPQAATLFIGLISAACCLLSSHVLLVFLSGSFPYLLGLVSLAVLVGRSKRLTGQPGYWRSPLYPLAPILGLCLAAVLAIATLFDADAGRPSILLLGGILIAALLWHHFVLSRRPGGWAPRLG
ncbi:MAG: APC family permease [Betaproteobacteria bacterium]